MNLDDIIEFDGEGTNLDFKREEYKNKEALLKDIMSMANALSTEKKRIVIGVKEEPGGEKEFIGLETMSDQSTLENIIQDNIEPNINFKYYPYNFKGTKLGIIEIFDNNDRPYMMKKDFNNKLRKGDSWIRKGSRQSRIIREDINKIFESRKNLAFENKIKIGFGKELRSEMNISKSKVKYEEIPSSIREKELKNLLRKLAIKYDEIFRKSIPSGELEYNALNLMKVGQYPLFNDLKESILVGYDRISRFPRYKNREQILKEIKELPIEYSDQDGYYFEQNSNKINFKIYNDGIEFLEDVKIELYFDSNVFLILDEIYEKPKSGINLVMGNNAQINYGYPKVYKEGEMIIVEEEHEQIRHKILTDVFFENLRIIVRPNVEVEESEVKYIISARNLPNHIEGSIFISIVE